MGKHHIIRHVIGASVALALLCSVPVQADDDTKDLGLAAALGLTAADGKTTMAGGAGKIEATIQATDAVLAAGAIIAGKAGPGKTAILSADDKNDWASLETVRAQLTEFTKEFAKASKLCLGAGPINPALMGASDKLSLKDVGAAFATSTAIAPIDVSVADRLLITAIMIKWPTPSDAVIPTEIRLKGGTGLLGVYDGLKTSAEGLRGCAAKEVAVKTLLEQFDTYAASLLATSEKVPTAPLMAAARLAEVPRVLRVAVESSGGTSIAKSSIWYTLGLPGAVTVSSGLIVSYRLYNAEGQLEKAGIIRCAERPRNLRGVAARAMKGWNTESKCIAVP